MSDTPRTPRDPPPRPRIAEPAGLHPRNRHQGRYDFAKLVRASPGLAAHVVASPAGTPTIDFSRPEAVRALNRALLNADYGIAHWDIPDGFLCPPVPGRADYVHGLADLLADGNGGVIPRGPGVRVLDIGVGANVIYPLLGHAEYGWRFVGSEVDASALQAAAAIVAANGLAASIELRQQPDRGAILAGVVEPGERFELSVCNPPFHASAEDAARGSRRKSRQLGQPETMAATLNFGGRPGELWCTGGELSFVRRMIRESAGLPSQVLWFSSLVSSAANLPELHRLLRKSAASEVREVAMAQGSKQSRFVAWTFLDASERDVWRDARWTPRG